MVSAPWVPRAGEVVRIDFSPTRGHEQAAPRPAVVLSHHGFNDKSSRIVCVPCTTKLKGYPFEVAISELQRPSAALVDQIRTLDWRERGASSAGFTTAAELAEIRAKLQSLLGLR
jgi:mRNA interferase MazF